MTSPSSSEDDAEGQSESLKFIRRWIVFSRFFEDRRFVAFGPSSRMKVPERRMIIEVQFQKEKFMTSLRISPVSIPKNISNWKILHIYIYNLCGMLRIRHICQSERQLCCCIKKSIICDVFSILMFLFVEDV